MMASADQIPMAEVGDLSETCGETTFEWRIKNFESLSNENVCYASPRFYFSGACWRIELFPYGQTEMDSEGWIGLYLCKQSSDSPVFLKFSLGFKVVDIQKALDMDFRHVFKTTNCSIGSPKIILRSKLLKKKSMVLPSDILTVTCTMKNSKPKDAAESYFNRLLDVSDNLKEIYQKEKKTDFTVKVQGGEKIGAHRLILESRSPYFAAMLSYDTQESQTNEVTIEDLDKSAVDNILCYIYSGDINEVTTENVLSVYAAAEKYDMTYVKKVCIKFILDNLSAEWVCDVIKFADLYNEDELGCHAKEYFMKQADEILGSEKWKSFIDKNPVMGNELLTSIVIYTSKNYIK